MLPPYFYITIKKQEGVMELIVVVFSLVAVQVGLCIFGFVKQRAGLDLSHHHSKVSLSR